MPCDSRHEILFEPVRIGPKTLPNRFYQVPHCTGFGVEKPWSQARHRAVKAEGGWGAVCTEYCTVSPDSDETPYVSARMWDDLDVRALAVMCDAAHELGALAGIELSHTGVHGENSESRLPAMAPSQIASDFAAGVVPKAMTKRDIRRLREDWGAAARRSRTAGFDIVYVYGAHTYLPGQFLSPHYNRRTDENGGSLR
ncbi:MAG: dimethylamine/trimethylamine dehydrogenase, partial [Gaiellales bacterium]|nr:dimethylamine/trimethylamine dehydrogenase [Gaiellales bacterium]